MVPGFVAFWGAIVSPLPPVTTWSVVGVSVVPGVVGSVGVGSVVVVPVPPPVWVAGAGLTVTVAVLEMMYGVSAKLNVLVSY